MTQPTTHTVKLIHPYQTYTHYQLTRACKICIAISRGDLILTEKGSRA